MRNVGIGLLGGGGHSDEVEEVYGNVVFRAVSKEYVNEKAAVDICSPGQYVSAGVHIAVGAPALKRRMEELWPGTKYVTVVSDYALVGRSCTIGAGSYIASGAILTTDVKVGRHVTINVHASIHHGCEIGDFSCISPGANVGGNVKIGQGAFIGIGATVSNGLKIAEGAVVGAGAVLIADAQEQNGVYVGVPARLLKVNTGWLNEI